MGNIEMEVKVLEINKEEVLNKIIKLGAIKKFDGIVYDKHFDIYDSIGNRLLDNNGFSFRIRQKGEEILYTIKESIICEEETKCVKTAFEIEESIENLENFFNFVENKLGKNIDKKLAKEKIIDFYTFSDFIENNIGMTKVREKKKHRISYKFSDFTFDIDKYDGIPIFMEIEGENQGKIYEMVDILGLSNHKIVDFGATELFLYYGK